MTEPKKKLSESESDNIDSSSDDPITYEVSEKDSIEVFEKLKQTENSQEEDTKIMP